MNFEWGFLKFQKIKSLLYIIHIYPMSQLGIEMKFTFHFKIDRLADQFCFFFLNRLIHFHLANPE